MDIKFRPFPVICCTDNKFLSIKNRKLGPQRHMDVVPKILFLYIVLLLELINFNSKFRLISSLSAIISINEIVYENRKNVKTQIVTISNIHF